MLHLAQRSTRSRPRLSAGRQRKRYSAASPRRLLLHMEPAIEQYDEVMRRPQESGEMPADGFDYHVAFLSDGQLLVSEVWDSQQQLEAFGARIVPLLADVPLEFRVNPRFSRSTTSSGASASRYPNRTALELSGVDADRCFRRAPAAQHPAALTAPSRHEHRRTGAHAGYRFSRKQSGHAQVAVGVQTAADGRRLALAAVPRRAG